jgi:hypothetical protein
MKVQWQVATCLPSLPRPTPSRILRSARSTGCSGIVSMHATFVNTSFQFPMQEDILMPESGS